MALPLPQLLKIMVDEGGTDLHITTNSSPLIRVHGLLKRIEHPTLSPSETKQMIYSILNDNQKYKFEENWELDFSFGIKGLARFRANVFMQRGAVAGAFRRIPYEIWSFEKLGLPAIVPMMTNKPRGLILVTGPTGSGKTTTLYSSLKTIASREINITTIEDPIEMVLEEFNQTAVLPKIGIDFANALRHILRQDPDVIMVGEIRDGETAQYSIQAALTGHLVFSTLHTNDAATSISRLTDLGVERFLVSSTLIGSMAQRLVRRICPHCTSERVLTAEEVNTLRLTVPAGRHVKVQEGQGCFECRGTGYLGRSGIFEILAVDDAIKELIVTGADAPTIKREAVKNGMRTLRQSALRKLAEGITTFEEVVRVTGL
jgi:pilus retraction protein PilT